MEMMNSSTGIGRVVLLVHLLVFSAGLCMAGEDGFVPLFDGKTLDGWERVAGESTYSVTNGCIRGECVMHTPWNTFLVTKKHYENFIFRCEFLCEYGNSGLQFRSGLTPTRDGRGLVQGYQQEITPKGHNNGHIYDEARRGCDSGYGYVWLDVTTPPRTVDRVQASCSTNGVWNSLEIRCCGPHIQTFVNGIAVADILDDEQQTGFFGLQIHAQMHDFRRPGVTWWRNIRIKELVGTADWKKIDAKPVGGCIDGGEWGDVMVRAKLPKGVPLSALVVRGIPWKAGHRPLFNKLFRPDAANEVTTIIYGDRIAHRLNGTEVFDGPLEYCGAKPGTRGRVEILSDNPGCTLRIASVDGLKED